MTVTIDGITYDGTPDEIRQIVDHLRPRSVTIAEPAPQTWWDSPSVQRNWDGSPRVTCEASGRQRKKMARRARVVKVEWVKEAK